MRQRGRKGDIMHPHSTRDFPLTAGVCVHVEIQLVWNADESVMMGWMCWEMGWMNDSALGYSEKGFRNKWLFCLQMINAMSLPI
ncbi:hypothetical protein CEXT_247101 [Caerostris extrusa]|uniref:Uncharacterized protein n=1 Tax=Caerostris extrusa TaxID=172846 RepID=A0AAV4XFA5_CAEEX|nr:hypothetical protein CEXT_247101 [Caerostris extrusa]